MTRGERVIAFIERFCIVPEGKLIGQPMRLDPFQKEFILAVYDNPAGTDMAILSIARKNGKTGLIAGILLAHLVGPEAVQNTQIVSGALSREQAAIVFNLAVKMVTPGHSGAADLKAAMQHGTVEGMSVGFSVAKDDYTIIPTGRIFKNIQALREISVCTFPANEQAGIAAMKSVDGIETIRDVENWLRDSVGLTKSQAVGLIARFKSAIRSESEGDGNEAQINALLQSIKSFPSNLGN
ncbi:hypothetical protein AI2694V1_1740 [Enterobacter cloacae]|uniref:HK97 family phage prohead protease n=2 Tax=Enterobacter cloacae complex TaxID=354276 RepID=UPI0008FFD446|nr:HK97 family phage prohead protease [Enterobacter asburiae]CAE7070814.1 hypothetical protein AI2694V1_1495 [Enterobacter cloacae]CAE7075652.1 hypothetical protein AI2694V1_1740 [Enterobacter cloacae]CAE7470483.1 hypothetical protein AI2674V1_1484 [Enterobacter cloacae]CAE7473287.1 hypothetical protein AI2674V1_1729 [Enterobacter cloacae]CAE7497938.1 hypothetical protein AI2679V1_1496 [Enterobacter cloacae]